MTSCDDSQSDFWCAGEFLVEEDSQTTARLECSGLLGSAGPETQAVTHRSASEKNVLQIFFLPDLGS